MVGLEGLVAGWELRVVVSLLIGLAAVALALLIRHLQNRLEAYVKPVALDLIISILLVAIVVVTTVLIADLWGQTDTLIEQLGFLRLDERAPEATITVVIVIAIYVFSGIARRLLDDLRYESGAITDHQREVSGRLTQLTLWGIGLVVILGVWDIDLTGLLVGAGFAGIVIGLAARKTLGSLIAGLVLMFSRPFEVGDWVTVGDRDGLVTDITLMTTRIRGFDGERIVVPNDVITGEIVTNRSREGRLRVEVDIGIDYDDDIGTATELAREIAADLAAEHENALKSPAPSVLVRSLGDSAVVLTVRLWIANPSSRAVNSIRHELFTRIKEAYADADITIPFPQRALSVREDESGFSRPPPEHET